MFAEAQFVIDVVHWHWDLKCNLHRLEPMMIAEATNCLCFSVLHNMLEPMMVAEARFVIYIVQTNFIMKCNKQHYEPMMIAEAHVSSCRGPNHQSHITTNLAIIYP